MRFLSVCSGIEAASVAWNPLGWEACAFSEIDPYASALLAHHYPHVPNLGDMTNFRDWPDDLNPDALCGGTPCQSYSVAGLRKGLDDPRGNLMLTFAAIAAKYRPRWLVWENVPGVLSSDRGRDFAGLLGVLTGRSVTPPAGGWSNTGVLAGIDDAYGIAWRVFDAQYAGVAQRRERVFLVGYLGDWRRAAAVLLERQSLSGHPAPSRGPRQDPAAGTLRSTDGGSDVDHARARHLVACGGGEAAEGRLSSAHASGRVAAFGGADTRGSVDVAATLLAHGWRGDFESETFITFDETQITHPENRSNPRPGDPCHTLPSHGRPPTMIGFNARQDPDAWHDRTGPLDVLGYTQAIAFQERGREGGRAIEIGGDVAYALTASGPEGGRSAERNVLTPSLTVRRFTPVECERLQGFPDGYTAVPYNGRAIAADSPRYKGLGNSWAVPCARWIGERIEMLEALT